MEWAVPIAALIVTLGALLLTVLNSRSSSERAYIDQLEKRITECEQGRKEEREERRRMRELYDAARAREDEARERELLLRVQILELTQRLDLALETGPSTKGP